MTWVTDWVRQLVLLVFVVSAAQMLLPADRMRPYVRFVLGLVIVSALLTSVLDLSTFEPDWDGLFDLGGAGAPDGAWAERGEALAAAAAAQVLRLDETGLQRRVAEVAALVLGEPPRRIDVHIGPGGEIRSVEIWPGGPLALAEDEAARLVGGLLGLSPRFVEFFDGGEGGIGIR